jgi:pentatricopeptide repeat protein
MDAQSVFNKMSTRNAVTWNAMLAGYAIHGHFKEAFEHFEWMCGGVEMSWSLLFPFCQHAAMQV